MLSEQNKRERLIFVCNLLNIAGWGCLLLGLVLPSWLSQTNKAKGVEARNHIGAMNRAQQAFNLEKGGFADSMDKMGVGIKSQTENYDYLIKVWPV
jgi:type IV pilus assembly protein PilA